MDTRVLHQPYRKPLLSYFLLFLTELGSTSYKHLLIKAFIFPKIVWGQLLVQSVLLKFFFSEQQLSMDLRNHEGERNAKVEIVTCQ